MLHGDVYCLGPQFYYGASNRNFDLDGFQQ